MNSYRPSNGTEGECFQAQWCDRCWRDRNQRCSILAKTLFWAITDPEYPKQWNYDDNNKPQCTAFLSYAQHEAQIQAMYQSRRKASPLQCDLFGGAL